MFRRVYLDNQGCSCLTGLKDKQGPDATTLKKTLYKRLIQRGTTSNGIKILFFVFSPSTFCDCCVLFLVRFLRGMQHSQQWFRFGTMSLWFQQTPILILWAPTRKVGNCTEAKTETNFIISFQRATGRPLRCFTQLSPSTLHQEHEKW